MPQPMSPDLIDLECDEEIPEDISNDEHSSPKATVPDWLDENTITVIWNDYNAIKRRCYRMEKQLEKAREFRDNHFKFKKDVKLLQKRKDMAINGLQKTIKDMSSITF